MKRAIDGLLLANAGFGIEARLNATKTKYRFMSPV
jgi:hypothetical protein